MVYAACGAAASIEVAQHGNLNRSAHWEKLDPMRFSEITRVLLVCSIVPMLKYPEAAASYAIAFWIVERLRRRIVCQSRFAQVVVCIRDIHEIGPFRSQKIEAH